MAHGWGGANWEFRSDTLAHRVQGYRVVIMTHSDSGGELLRDVRDRVARAYVWIASRNRLCINRHSGAISN